MHLDEGTIHGWLDGALDAEEARRVEEHVASCATCAAAVAEARGVIAGASRILLALDDVPSGVLPGSAERAPPVPPVARSLAARRDPWWRSVPLRAAAAILVVAAGVWATRSSFSPGRLAESAPAATMVRAEPTTPTDLGAPAPAPPPPAIASPRVTTGEGSALPFAGRSSARGPEAAGQAAVAQQSAVRRERAGVPALQRGAERESSAAPEQQLRKDAFRLNEVVTAGAGTSAQVSTADSITAAPTSELAQRSPSSDSLIPTAPAAAPKVANRAGAARGVPGALAGVGVRSAAVGRDAAAPAPSPAASVAAMEDMAAMMERSTPREIPGLRLLKHTVSEIAQGRTLESGRDQVERVRYAHTLLYELAPGTQVELVVALPAVVTVPLEARSSERQRVEFSDHAQADTTITRIFWRDPDGSDLELRGRVSEQVLQSLRARVRKP
jgi:hypothetical protein